jgi:hypothetical protein
MTGIARKLSRTLIAASVAGLMGFACSKPPPEDVTIYANVGSYPTLYSAAEVWSTTEPTLFMFGRSETLSHDPNDYPPSVVSLNTHWEPGFGPGDEMLDFIDDHNSSNVTLYIQDTHYPYALQLRARTDATVETRLIEDGSYTYNQYNTLHGEDAPLVWDTYMGQYEGWLSDVSRGDESNLPQVATPQVTVAPCFARTSDRVQHLVIIEDIVNESVADEVAKCDLIQSSAAEVVSKMDDATKRSFFKLVKFDRDRFVGYFDASPKPNIVVTGTNPTPADVQIAAVRVVFDRFGEDYDLFFKPHPGGFGGHAKGGESGDTIGLEKEIVLFPGQMPFEVLLWTLNDRISMIGGFPSTLYLSEPTPEKIRFYFAASEKNLSAGERYMYDAGLMPNVVFIDPANPHWP